MNIHSNKRQPGESFKEYKLRLLQRDAALKRYLKGRVIYAACQIVNLPEKGKDGLVDGFVAQRVYRDLQAVLMRDGKLGRVGRTPGVPYRKPPAVALP